MRISDVTSALADNVANVRSNITNNQNEEMLNIRTKIATIPQNDHHRHGNSSSSSSEYQQQLLLQLLQLQLLL